MSAPIVSVCLPNLNNRPFLQERVETILCQTCTDWELVVSDNYSDDGAWKLFEELARRDDRVRIAQAPRRGMYVNWNRCIQRARGKYVYVATSDDTMAADCLEKLVAALEARPDCDLAHCALRMFDEHGRDVESGWSEGSVFARSSGPLLHRTHVRTAPFDGVLHLLGDSVYVSITQLLIRRSLFDRIGYFRPDWGSAGDFNWDMRAGLVANTVHVPGTWGGWRVHSSQATANIAFSSPEHHQSVAEMIEHAIAASRTLLPAELGRRIGAMAAQACDLRAFIAEVAARRNHSAPQRWGFLARRVLAGSPAAREYTRARLLRRPCTDWVRTWFDAGERERFLVPACR